MNLLSRKKHHFYERVGELLVDFYESPVKLNTLDAHKNIVLQKKKKKKMKKKKKKKRYVNRYGTYFI